MPVPKIIVFSEKFWWKSFFCLAWKKSENWKKNWTSKKIIRKIWNFWNFSEFQKLIFDKKHFGKSWILVENSSKVLVVLTS